MRATQIRYGRDLYTSADIIESPPMDSGQYDAVQRVQFTPNFKKETGTVQLKVNKYEEERIDR
ncbi:hypothetical protein Taro_037612 [Colocasia esculenta]|uniref:Uncharacterized protein n=1 Tax=Colocasia esculenta TaxID=4460 RepID=A0A843WL96_COLES|nr:hypothetical protein [Colocasia esculenta]